MSHAGERGFQPTAKGSMVPPSFATGPTVPDRAQRRLAAILAIDMVGYSRRMEVDETGTIARMHQHRDANSSTLR